MSSAPSSAAAIEKRLMELGHELLQWSDKITQADAAAFDVRRRVRGLEAELGNREAEIKLETYADSSLKNADVRKATAELRIRDDAQCIELREKLAAAEREHQERAAERDAREREYQAKRLHMQALEARLHRLPVPRSA